MADANLGDVDPAGSRQLGRRSAVCAVDDQVIVGLADGSLVGFDADLEEQWRVPGFEGSVVTLVPFADGVLAGERGADGEVRYYDDETGTLRWGRSTADEVGDPQRDTRFFLPFVVDAVVDGERAYVAARRYERGDGGSWTFESVVYAFDTSGEEVWRYRTDASPISLDARDGRVAVAYNRCPGDHQDGLLVLDAETGDVRRRWDPPGDGQRRVGDVSLVESGMIVVSHADYRGYALDSGGVRWSLDLGRPVERGDERVYAYPNHVHATDAGAVFVTGNTYPEDGRETDARHPNEHTAVGVDSGGERRWTADVGGFSHEIAADGDTVAVPVAQHFRERDAGRHGVDSYGVGTGVEGTVDTTGVATAVALDSDRLAAVEEPVAYHDDGAVHGEYRLLVRRVN
ncbi:PQQ-binding-like beta-propeller repeat protein [Halospeciosus flavus]|uniref:PQQ-binding-like beta-propeller repeat protein n=1 Tax=Halospeciosus flavus TaxID=3032283 RepID=A0ABD5Z0E0_9EURY|nr:PQQ-binding-like beta-propeller repeat protein [Halospeciosus flavus]